MIWIAIGAALSGCVTYSYNGGTYHSPQDAYAAQKQFEDQILTHISPAPKANPGAAIVLIPSRQTIEALGVTRKNSPPQELVDYTVNTLMTDYGYFPKYLEASKAFSAVESRVVDHTAQEARQAATNYAATIYLQMLSPTQVGWFLMRPDGSAPIEIHFDSTAEPGAPRIDSWIKNIVDNVNGRS